MISIGNSGVPGKKKPKLTVVIAPIGSKADGPKPPSTENSPSPPNPMADSDDNPGSGVSRPSAPKPGESLFHDQSQSCSTCEYFDPSGGNGYGECTMHVPEADFSQADPSLSWCKWYEGKNEDQDQDQGQAPMSDSQPSAPSTPSA